MRTDTGRKLYSIGESYRIVYHAFRTAPLMIRAEKHGEMSKQCRERVMIAVTEVNGCPMCSYAHSKWALETGMSKEEIRKLFAGIADDVPANEMEAVLFAQHYADTRGNPSRQAWERIVEIYGPAAAKGILGAARAITMGNVYGIAWGSFFNRFRGKPDKRSNICYEAGIMLTSIFYFPVAAVHAGISALFKFSLIRFR